MNEKNTLLEKVAENFKTIRDGFRKRISKCGLKFDEDVFSDTLIKCDERLADREYIGDKEMMAYFWTAFKTNTLRELKYARNNVTDEIPDIPDEGSDYDDVDEMFVSVSRLIRDKFGDEMYRLFTLHANGKSYEELEAESGHDDLRYRFRRIREYVRKNT